MLAAILVASGLSLSVGLARVANVPADRTAAHRATLAADSTGNAVLFTIAGAESDALATRTACSLLAGSRFGECDTGRARSWPATTRGAGFGTSLAHLPDGTIIVCSGEEGVLFRLGPDGRMSLWAVSGLPADHAGFLEVNTALDGRVIALAQSRTGAQRVVAITADGTASQVGPANPVTTEADDRTWDRVAILTDGSLLAFREGGELVRIDPAGNPEGRPAPGGPARPQAGGDSPGEIVALPDGGYVLANPNGLIRRVSASGAVTTIANVAAPNGLAGGADGSLYIAGNRGLLQLTGGLTRTLLPLAEGPSTFTTDGTTLRHARTDRVREPGALDVLPDGELIYAAGEHSRVGLIAPGGRSDRLAVALPRTNRIHLRAGQLAIRASQPATVELRVTRRGRLVARRTTAVVTGRTTLRVRVPTDSETHVLSVTARTPDGKVATHRLTLIPSRTLSNRVVRRIAEQATETDVGFSQGPARCRRSSRTTFRCREVIHDGERVTVGPPTAITLRSDGLLEVRGPEGDKLFEPR